GGGAIQPALVETRDGSVLAFMRNRGAADAKIWISRSADRGATWSPIEAASLDNPDSPCDVLRLRSGRLLLAFNDTARPGMRTPLTLALSEDDGKTWVKRRGLETGRGAYSYPALAQTADGGIHVVYAWLQPDTGGTIRHAEFTEEWLRSGG